MENSRASYIDGRHFTEFLDEVRNLKASANYVVKKRRLFNGRLNITGVLYG